MDTKDIMSEKQLEKRLVFWCSKNNYMCIKLLSTFIKGLPDRMIIGDNRTVEFVEFKSTGMKLRRVQVYIHEKLKKYGFTVYIIDSIDSLENFKQCFLSETI